MPSFFDRDLSAVSNEGEELEVPKVRRTRNRSLGVEERSSQEPVRALVFPSPVSLDDGTKFPSGVKGELRSNQGVPKEQKPASLNSRRLNRSTNNPD